MHAIATLKHRSGGKCSLTYLFPGAWSQSPRTISRNEAHDPTHRIKLGIRAPISLRTQKNTDGRKRVKTAAHIGDDLLRACLLLQQQRPIPSADLSFSSPHYASRCEAALVVRRAGACGSVQRWDRQRAVSSRAAGQSVYRQVGNYSTQ
jgi:hypothetical protein